jgi:5-methylcytosine-specific restriction endonuclease McrA
VILGKVEYYIEAQKVWRRDLGRCAIRHRQPGKPDQCWGALPYFSMQWIDHVVKRSQGGSDTLENMRLACPPCHDWADNQGGKLLEREAESNLKEATTA